jgi:hypothetical protein
MMRPSIHQPGVCGSDVSQHAETAVVSGVPQSHSPVLSRVCPSGGGCRLIDTAPLLHSDQLATAGISLQVFDGMSAVLSQPPPPRLPQP